MSLQEFEEYLDLYKSETIVRQLLPYKYANTDDERLYRIGSGYIINDTDTCGTIKCKMENIFYEILYREDYTFLYGTPEMNVDGLDKLCSKTTLDLSNAIIKYLPKYVLANRQTLKKLDIPDVIPIESQNVKSDVVYLMPEITEDIAEFLVLNDVTKDLNKLESGYNMQEFYEWVYIDIHKPEKFIKVSIL